MERSSVVSTRSKTNCLSHCGHSKTSGNIASRLSHRITLLSRNSLLDHGVCGRVASVPFVAQTLLSVPAYPFLLGGRSTVGQLALDQHIGVQVPASQPRFSSYRL